VPNTLSQTCVASDTNLIKAEAPKNFQSYCRWWTLASRSSSAIPGVSVAQLSKSCQCLLTGKTATTAVKVTSTKTTAAAATSTLACKKRRKVRRTVTIEVPAEATPLV
jgi:uncharacterized membrane protein